MEQAAKAVKPIPDGYRTITPYLIVDDVAPLIEFLQKVFDAKTLFSMSRPDGKIGHAEIEIGDSKIMIGSAMADWKALPSMIYLYMPDTDATYKRALEAGAKSLMEPADQFYGDRNAGVQDSSGVTWWIATHVEDVSPEEMKRRHDEHFSSGQCS
ncbi:MAG: VOC family protein [Acidobacteriota bacterium]